MKMQRSWGGGGGRTLGLRSCFYPFEDRASLSKGNWETGPLSCWDRGPVCRGRGLGWVLTVLLSPRLQEALPGLIWDLGQQLGDLSLESGGLEQESGRSSGEHG